MSHRYGKGVCFEGVQWPSWGKMSSLTMETSLPVSTKAISLAPLRHRVWWGLDGKRGSEVREALTHAPSSQERSFCWKGCMGSMLPWGAGAELLLLLIVGQCRGGRHALLVFEKLGEIAPGNRGRGTAPIEGR